MAHRAVLHEDELALLHLQFFGHGDDGGCLPDGFLDLFLKCGDPLRRLITLRGLLAEVAFIDLFAGIDLRIVRPFDLQHAQGTLVEGAEDGVVDQNECTRNVNLEFDNRRAARWDKGSLHIFLAYGSAPFSIDSIKDLANNME